MLIWDAIITHVALCRQGFSEEHRILITTAGKSCRKSQLWVFGFKILFYKNEKKISPAKSWWDQPWKTNLQLQEQHYQVYQIHALTNREIELGANVMGGKINSMVSGKRSAWVVCGSLPNSDAVLLPNNQYLVCSKWGSKQFPVLPLQVP